MLMTNESVTDFEILGSRVRINPAKVSGETTPNEIVEYVRQVAMQIKSAGPGLDNGQVFLLAALKIAEERLNLNREYRENIEVLQASAQDALRFIEEVSPTAL
jgi:cell division protein ZapA (FtsZ GTPase activity inhibitor)